MQRFVLLAGLAAALPLAAAEPGLRAMTAAEVAALGGASAGTTYLTADPAQMRKNADANVPLLAGTHLASYAAHDLRPNSAGARLNQTAVPGGMLCSSGSTDSNGELQVRLPQGAKFEFLRIWGADDSTENLTVSLLRRCQPSFDPGNATITNLAALTTSGSPGNFTVATSIPNDVTVDNETCAYVARVRFGDSNTSCPGPLSLYKIRVQWSD